MSYIIASKKDYHQAMVEIYKLMDKGEGNLSAAEIKKLAAMSLAAEKYEDEVLQVWPPKNPLTIVEAVELKLFEKKMTQTKLAEQLHIGQSKVSEIMSGKRKPDIPFLKGIHSVLNIDAEFILQHA